MAYVGNSPAEIYSSVQKQTITGDGTVGPYTLDYPAATNDVSVFVNNVRQEPTVAYTVSGTSMTMTGAVASTDDFYVVFSGLTQGTITPPDGSVTQAKLSPSLILIPTGMVAPFAVNTAPTGWLECDGSAVSRTTYAGLFSALGTTWGVGDGSTTFNVPDARAEFIRGWDNGKGTDSGRTFASSQTDELKSHFHRPFNYSSDNTRRFFTGYGSGSGYSYPASGGVGTFLYSNLTSQTDPTGGTETRPRNIAMMYCVKT